LVKRLLDEKVLSHIEAGTGEKTLFTIHELKEIAKKQKPRSAKTKINDFLDELPLGEAKPELEINTGFFRDLCRPSLEKIGELFREYGYKGTMSAQQNANMLKPNGFVMTNGKPQPIWKTTKVLSKEEKGTKGAHWSEKEKELFVNCLMTFGKNWEAIAPKFPNKTIKQLRNFFQNNKDKLCLNGYVRGKC